MSCTSSLCPPPPACSTPSRSFPPCCALLTSPLLMDYLSLPPPPTLSVPHVLLPSPHPPLTSFTSSLFFLAYLIHSHDAVPLDSPLPHLPPCLTTLTRAHSSYSFPFPPLFLPQPTFQYLPSLSSYPLLTTPDTSPDPPVLLPLPPSSFILHVFLPLLLIPPVNS